MNALKNILGKFFAAWAAFVFVSTMLILLIPAAIAGIWEEPRRSHIMQVAFQLWMDVFFFFSFVRREYRGRKNFEKGKAYVVVCNHHSFLDPMLSSPGIPAANKTIAKYEMSKIPLFGLVYKRGSVLVNRKSDESRKQSYVQMKKVLAMGLHMCIYPEGTRNKSGQSLQPFHDGAFRLAVETGTEVMPALLFHTRKVLPPNKGFFFWPHKVGMHFLPPVSPAGKTSRELKDEVYEIMKAYYESQPH